MHKAHAHPVVAGDAVLGRALALNDPGRQGFPGDEQRLCGAVGHKTDFTALTVEAGGDYLGEEFVGLEPDVKANGRCN